MQNARKNILGVIIGTIIGIFIGIPVSELIVSRIQNEACANVHSFVGFEVSRTENPDFAIRQINRLIGQCPDTYQLYIALGETYRKQENYQLAKEEYNHAKELMKDSSDVVDDYDYNKIEFLIENMNSSLSD